MDERDRRGQLLLVAALGLAVAFVVLALVLNAVVFTENLATRNHGQTDSVVAYERAAEGDVGALLAQTNRHNNSDSDELAATLTANVETWDANASVLAVGSGHLTQTTVASVANGTRVVQSTRRNFSNATGVDDWTAATGVDATRRFHVVAEPTTADALTLNVSNGTTAWRVRVVENVEPRVHGRGRPQRERRRARGDDRPIERRRAGPDRGHRERERGRWLAVRRGRRQRLRRERRERRCGRGQIRVRRRPGATGLARGATE
ncbi:DUF7261 family protein [Halobacterium bonnevillei]|uniref:Uncharacterized protein n=1 Tax=Halobacterium bonnevillei TaxID=2692200 RepID=A0A6B0SGX6_9EURY|nr:hypothetical protein [Halobacterium bonnevillei]MXR19826.1 hypothetical protein [Halobacterium bonnevillei]